MFRTNLSVSIHNISISVCTETKYIGLFLDRTLILQSINLFINIIIYCIYLSIVKLMRNKLEISDYGVERLRFFKP